MVDRVDEQSPFGPAASLQVQVYTALNELPSAYLCLFQEAGLQDFFLTLGWFQNFADTALDQGATVRIYGVAPPDQSRPAAGMFVARGLTHRSHATSLRKLTALTNYYSCFYDLHVGGVGPHARKTLQALARAIAAERPSWDAVEIRPLDVGSENFSSFVEALQGVGFVVQTYFCFGNWYLPVKGRSFSQYLESLPSPLKNTLRRKRKKLEKSGQIKIQIVTGTEGLEAAIQDYTRVYVASWKHPEPYPKFIPGLIRLCAETGTLRLGVVHLDGEPVASQFWVVHNGKAMIYRLAYDERFAELSAGTILTATLMQHVLDVDRVDEVDYLSGDDAYKKDWMSHRRERWGILALNARTPRGAVAVARHLGGRLIKRAPLWFSRRLTPGR
jgi:hypothetical protein